MRSAVLEQWFSHLAGTLKSPGELHKKMPVPTLRGPGLTGLGLGPGMVLVKRPGDPKVQSALRTPVLEASGSRCVSLLGCVECVIPEALPGVL